MNAAAAGVAVACVLLAGCAAPSEPMSDWERNHPELIGTPQAQALPKPPPAPRKANLIAFDVGPTATFRYFIDSASLSSFYKEKEVRYVMVARSPSGVENVTYEALRCTNQHRVLATGNADGTWNVRPGEWQEIGRQTATPQAVLRRLYFCPHNDPIQSVAEGVDALRRGGHPMVWVPENYNRR